MIDKLEFKLFMMGKFNFIIKTFGFIIFTYLCAFFLKSLEIFFIDHSSVDKSVLYNPMVIGLALMLGVIKSFSEKNKKKKDNIDNK